MKDLSKLLSTGTHYTKKLKDFVTNFQHMVHFTYIYTYVAQSHQVTLVTLTLIKQGYTGYPEYTHHSHSLIRLPIPELQQFFHLWAICSFFNSPCKTPTSSKKIKSIYFLSRAFSFLITRFSPVEHILY